MAVHMEEWKEIDLNCQLQGELGFCGDNVYRAKYYK